jgi:hypothetical protein
VSQFEVPPGRYQVRVASASGTRNGSVVYDLEVPDFRSEPLMMSGVSLSALPQGETVILQSGTTRKSNQKSKQCRSAVCEPSDMLESLLTPWRTESRASGATLLNDLPVPPTTIREFTGNETLVLYAEVYDRNDRVTRDPPYAITLTAILRDATGSVVQSVSSERSSRAELGRSGGHAFALRLPLESVPAGTYAIDVEARSARDVSHTTRRRGIPIRVP